MRVEAKAVESLLNGSHILKGIDLDIGDRELVGVIGPNGSEIGRASCRERVWLKV